MVLAVVVVEVVEGGRETLEIVIPPGLGTPGSEGLHMLRVTQQRNSSTHTGTRTHTHTHAHAHTHLSVCVCMRVCLSIYIVINTQSYDWLYCLLKGSLKVDTKSSVEANNGVGMHISFHNTMTRVIAKNVEKMAKKEQERKITFNKD